MEPVKQGRTVHSVKFSWAWKSLDEARVTDEENERHSSARRKDAPDAPDAPPLVEAQSDPVVREGITQLLGTLTNNLRATEEHPTAAESDNS